MPSYLAWHIVCPSSGRLPSHPVGHLVALDSSMYRDPADPNMVVGHDSSDYLDDGPCPISGCQSGCPVPLPPAAAASSRRGLNPASAVLPSSIELFHLYRQMLAQGAKLSSGAPLLDPARTFAKHLDDYADSVLSARLDRVGRPAAGPPPPRPPPRSPPTGSPSCSTRPTSAARHDHPAGRAHPCASTARWPIVSTLSHRATASSPSSRVPPQRSRAASSAPSSAPGASCATCHGCVWTLSATSPLTWPHCWCTCATPLPPTCCPRDVWRRAVCDRVVEAVAAVFLAALVACRPISPLASVQLLGAYAPRKALEDFLTLQQPPPENPSHQPSSFTAHHHHHHKQPSPPTIHLQSSSTVH